MNPNILHASGVLVQGNLSSSCYYPRKDSRPCIMLQQKDFGVFLNSLTDDMKLRFAILFPEESWMIECPSEDIKNIQEMQKL